MTNFVPAKLAYKVFEPAGGANDSLSPIIFLHGVTGQKENWSDIPQVIADKSKRKAYAVDARNHGDSEYTDAFNFDMNVDDLFHFMDQIHVQKAVLVGHSMGGISSIKAALKKPERVEMVFSEDMFTKKCPVDILDSVCGLIDVWVAGVKNIPKELSEKEAITWIVDDLYSKIPADTPYLTPKEKLKGIEMKFNRTPDGGFDVKFNKEVVTAALKDPDTVMSENCGQYDGPAYFIYGSVSPFNVGKEEENIKKHFPKAELIEFENATHNVHIEYPEKFAEAVLQRLG